MNVRSQVILTTSLLLLSTGVALAQELKITEGPVVENTTTTSAMVAWSTNAPSSTMVKYGTDPKNLDEAAQTPWGSLTHRVTIKNLAPGTTYYFQAISGQAQGSDTTAMSQVGTFRTRGGAAGWN
jgi:hypothetical protein